MQIRHGSHITAFVNFFEKFSHASIFLLLNVEKNENLKTKIEVSNIVLEK